MSSFRQIFADVVIVIATVALVIFLYQTYAGDTIKYLFGEQRQTIFIDDLAIQVSYADTPAKLAKGLGGVESLRDREGMLFIFPRQDYYKMWMKDMKIPIDIIWINNDMEIVHIEQNVRPDPYYATYISTQPARFVLEMNAFFTQEYGVEVGSRVTIPAADLPEDLRKKLQ